MLAYLKFLLKSTNHHGVHSPFVFNLVTQVFCKKEKTKQLQETILEIKHQKKEGFSKRRMRILYHLVNYLQPKSILQIGMPQEPFTKIILLAQPKIKISELKDALLKKNQTFDTVFINLGSAKELISQNLKELFLLFHNDSCLIVTHIRKSKENKQAWQLIKNHPKVTVSIDTYQWGFVFFRKEQQKEHFTIRV